MNLRENWPERGLLAPVFRELNRIARLLNNVQGFDGVQVFHTPVGLHIYGDQQLADQIPFPWKTEIITEDDTDIVRLHPGARQVIGETGEWVTPPTGDTFEWPFEGGDKVVWMSYSFEPEEDQSAWTGPEYGTPPAETPTLHVRIIASITAEKLVMQNHYGTIIIWTDDALLPAGEDNRDLMRWDADEERWVFFPYSQPTLGEGEIPVLSATDTTLAWGRVTGTIDDANIPDDDDDPCDQNTHPASTDNQQAGSDGTIYDAPYYAHPYDHAGTGGISGGGGTSSPGTADPDYHPAHDDCFSSVPPTETTP